MEKSKKQNQIRSPIIQQNKEYAQNVNVDKQDHYKATISASKMYHSNNDGSKYLNNHYQNHSELSYTSQNRNPSDSYSLNRYNIKPDSFAYKRDGNSHVISQNRDEYTKNVNVDKQDHYKATISASKMYHSNNDGSKYLNNHYQNHSELSYTSQNKNPSDSYSLNRYNIKPDSFAYKGDGNSHVISQNRDEYTKNVSVDKQDHYKSRVSDSYSRIKIQRGGQNFHDKIRGNDSRLIKDNIPNSRITYKGTNYKLVKNALKTTAYAVKNSKESSLTTDVIGGAISTISQAHTTYQLTKTGAKIAYKGAILTSKATFRTTNHFQDKIQSDSYKFNIKDSSNQHIFKIQKKELPNIKVNASFISSKSNSKAVIKNVGHTSKIVAKNTFKSLKTDGKKVGEVTKGLGNEIDTSIVQEDQNLTVEIVDGVEESYHTVKNAVEATKEVQKISKVLGENLVDHSVGMAKNVISKTKVNANLRGKVLDKSLGNYASDMGIKGNSKIISKEVENKGVGQTAKIINKSEKAVLKRRSKKVAKNGVKSFKGSIEAFKTTQGTIEGATATVKTFKAIANTVAIATKALLKPLIAVLAFKALFITMIVVILTIIFGGFVVFVRNEANKPPQNVIGLAPEVLQHRPMMEEFCREVGIEEYVPVLLAIMQVESGGRVEDVMQASESLGLPPNSLTTEQSIRQGCVFFAQLLNEGARHNVDLNTVIQSYNFGGAFIRYVAQNGSAYSFELATSFSRRHSGGVRVQYNNPIAISINGGWRYRFGNMFYLKLINQHLITTEFDGDELFQAIMEVALQFQGWDYVWGGANPNTGFDCSGLVQWVYGQVGINLPRTAQQQFNFATNISRSEARPGDLVFFAGTHQFAQITHVGIYTGNGIMFDSNITGIGFTPIHSGWWAPHFVSYGRVIH